MIGVGVPIGQEVAGPKKRALFGHRSAHRARSGEGRFQPWNGLTPTPGGDVISRSRPALTPPPARSPLLLLLLFNTTRTTSGPRSAAVQHNARAWCFRKSVKGRVLSLRPPRRLRNIKLHEGHVIYHARQDAQTQHTDGTWHGFWTPTSRQENMSKFHRALYGCSFGALKLCERCTVNRYTVSIFLCYRDILGIGRPTDLGCISLLGCFTGICRDCPEIVNLGDHLGCSGYCPHSRDSYYTEI